MHTAFSSWIGIDVSKDNLDVAFGSRGTVQRVPNNPTGFQIILDAARTQSFDGVICEATGIYHRGLAEFLSDHACPLSLVQPLFVKWFRASGFNLAKTDVLDACLLARFGEERQPRVSLPKPTSLRLLTDVLAARQALVCAIGQIKNRLRDQYQAAIVRQLWLDTVAVHEQQKLILEREIATTIASDPVLQPQDAQLQSVPGIGLVTSATLLVHLPELGTLNRKKIAALAGLAPYARDSGTAKGHRFIRGGRAEVRSLLVFAARSNRAHPAVKAHRQRMKIACQHTTAADAATARWLLVILNAMMRDNLTWEEMDIAQSAA